MPFNLHCKAIAALIFFLLSYLRTLPVYSFTLEISSINTLIPFFSPATKFVVELKDTDAIERETATMECTISSEKAEVKWYKSGKEIQMGRHYRSVAEGKIRKLIISNVSPDDEGDYMCTIGSVGSTAGLFVKRE